MELQLKDKKALVTGSTGGIGLAIATSLAREGAHVVVNGRTQARVDAALATIRREVLDARLTGIAADLGSADGVKSVTDQLPRVDVLVNNLGIFESKPFQDIQDEEWMRFFETNVMSGVRLSRAYLPSMREHNWGRVIFISSESAVNIPAEMIHYGTTKTAQVSVARGLAETLVGTGVTVNTVMPGPTRSEGVEAFVAGLAKEKNQTRAQVEKEFFKTMRPSSLLQRFIEPREIAQLVTFLASPLSSATHGAALRADGGLVRSIF